MLLQADVDRHARVGFDAFQLRGENNASFAVPFCNQPRLCASGCEVLHTAAFCVGAGLHGVHADQHVAGFHHIALFDQNGLNRATGQVLNRFLVGCHGHSAAERHALVQRRQ